MKNFDYKFILFFIIIFSITIFLYSSPAVSTEYVKIFLNIKITSVIIYSYSVIVSLLYKIKQENLRLNTFKEYRIFESIANIIITPTTLTGAFSIIKKIALQIIGEKLYFIGFSGIELYFLLMITFYLFFISLLDILYKSQIVFFNTNTIKVTKTKKSTTK